MGIVCVALTAAGVTSPPSTPHRALNARDLPRGRGDAQADPAHSGIRSRGCGPRRNRDRGESRRAAPLLPIGIQDRASVPVGEKRYQVFRAGGRLQALRAPRSRPPARGRSSRRPGLCSVAAPGRRSSDNARPLLVWLGLMRCPRSSNRRPVRTAGEPRSRQRRATVWTASLACTASNSGRSRIGALSFPKTISVRSDDAVRTRLAQ
jgi:hypothetical protein